MSFNILMGLPQLVTADDLESICPGAAATRGPHGPLGDFTVDMDDDAPPSGDVDGTPVVVWAYDRDPAEPGAIRYLWSPSRGSWDMW